MDKSLLSTAQLATQAALAHVYYGITNFRHPLRKQKFETIRTIQQRTKSLLTPLEAYTVFSTACSTRHLAGDAAELGVYNGSSARIILEAIGSEKALHLFDTFDGLPEVGKDDRLFHTGQFKVDLQRVKANLTGFNKVHFHVGYFPATAGPVADRSFSFVHLDADLYQSTLDGLRFFYPRMLRGGIILTHDYCADGPRRAFGEFFADKCETAIELPGNQAMIVKLQDLNETAA